MAKDQTQLNWKRGMLRLWVVLTAAWVCLCLFVFDLPALWTNATAPLIIKGGNYQLEFPLDVARPEIISAIAEFIIEERAKGHAEAMGPASESPQKIAEGIVGNYDRISLPVRLWRVFSTLILASLLPPLALLVLGCACAFVIRGFRPNPTR
ncbi:hypothetical protein ACLBYG_24815 [Methylobacterium sp. D53M]